MARTDSMAAEFEATGEAEVRRLVARRGYDAQHLAHALRWLDDKAADRSLGHGHPAPTRKARNDNRLPGDRTLDVVTRIALGGAGLAAAAGVVVGALSHH